MKNGTDEMVFIRVSNKVAEDVEGMEDVFECKECGGIFHDGDYQEGRTFEVFDEDRGGFPMCIECMGALGEEQND